MPLAVIHWKVFYRLQSYQSLAKNDWPVLASSKLFLLPDVAWRCCRMQRAVHTCALGRCGMAFLSAITLSFSWNDTWNIFTLESKQCSSAASSEVSCCRSWGPSTTANFSALLWISAFRGKWAWGVVQLLDLQTGYPLLLPACSPSSPLPAMEHLLCICPRVTIYNYVILYQLSTANSGSE